MEVDVKCHCRDFQHHCCWFTANKRHKHTSGRRHSQSDDTKTAHACRRLQRRRDGRGTHTHQVSTVTGLAGAGSGRKLIGLSGANGMAGRGLRVTWAAGEAERKKQSVTHSHTVTHPRIRPNSGLKQELSSIWAGSSINSDKTRLQKYPPWNDSKTTHRTSRGSNFLIWIHFFISLFRIKKLWCHFLIQNAGVSSCS